MKLVSVNAGMPVRLGPTRSGIYKTPVTGPVEITPFGIEVDTVCDRQHHGGLDQALYVYRIEDYEWWTEELDMAVEAGWFGDNLTLEGIHDEDLAIGDVIRINDVVLQVTAPRIPCATLGRRMEDPRFPRRFQLAERPGFYCRVLTTGTIRSGSSVDFEAFAAERISVLEVFRHRYVTKPDTATLDRLLRSPIAIMERQRLEALRSSAQ